MGYITHSRGRVTSVASTRIPTHVWTLIGGALMVGIGVSSDCEKDIARTPRKTIPPEDGMEDERD